VSREVRRFQVTVPFGTLVATPLVVPLTMPARIVDRIAVRIPPGPNGLVGFAFTASNNPIIPYNGGSWIVANDETITWDLTEQITSGAWQLTAYNLGLYDHTLYVEFLLSLPGQPGTTTTAAPIDPGLLVPTDGTTTDTGSGSTLDTPPPAPDDTDLGALIPVATAVT